MSRVGTGISHRAGKQSTPTLLAALLAAAATGGGLFAAPPRSSPPLPEPHETRPQCIPPVRPLLRETSAALPPEMLRVGTYVSVQVNVDEFGNNILGDAANEPSIAVDPRNGARMAIGWREFATIASSFREAGVAFSRDGGQNWINRGPLEPGVFRSDPVLRSNADGRFYYLSLASQQSPGWCAQFFTSTDGGATWSAPFGSVGGDKPWYVIDTRNGPGRGSIYFTWNPNATCDSTRYSARSFDGGLTTQSFLTPNNGRLWAGTLDIGPTGRVFSAGMPGGSSIAMVAYSDNFSNPLVANPTWTRPNFSGLGLIPGGVNGIGLCGQAFVKADPSPEGAGRVYLLASVLRFPNFPPADPRDVYISRSTDNGATWSAPIRLNTDPTGIAHQWFGMMDVAPNGRVDVLWNDTRNDPAPAGLLPSTSELYYRSSSDGGVTWSDETPVSPRFDHTLGYPFESGKLGDYYDLHSDNLGVDVAYAATFNGEQDVYYLRIGPQDCDRNGVGDDADIAGGAADCNGNGVPDRCEPDCDADGLIDACEIGPGAEADCDQNGVPDSCDPDCNGNGLVDACEVSNGQAPDLNANGVPDECDPDCNGNGRPDDLDAQLGSSADCDNDLVPDECEPDCNGNGLIDACEVVQTIVSRFSPVFAPFPIGASVTHDFGVLPPPDFSVTLSVQVQADLNSGVGESVDVLVNDVPVAMMFDGLENGCGIQSESVTIAAATFIQIVQGNPVRVTLVRRDADGIEACSSTRASCDLLYIVNAISSDANGNGLPDECEIAGDMNCNGAINVGDISPFIDAIVDPFRYRERLPQCDYRLGDMNGDGRVTAGDIGPFVTRLTGG